MYLELVQLIESYPFLGLSDSAWTMRNILMKQYRTCLEALMPEISFPEGTNSTIYETFTIYWAAAGLNIALRDACGRGHKRTSSEIHAGHLRVPHYIGLAESVALRSDDQRVRDCASCLLRIISEKDIQGQVAEDADHFQPATSLGN